MEEWSFEAIILAIGMACIGGGIKAGLDNLADAIRGRKSPTNEDENSDPEDEPP